MSYGVVGLCLQQESEARLHGDVIQRRTSTTVALAHQQLSRLAEEEREGMQVLGQVSVPRYCRGLQSLGLQQGRGQCNISYAMFGQCPIRLSSQQACSKCMMQEWMLGAMQVEVALPY